MKAIAALLPLLLSGCYLIKQAGGQIDVLLHQREIADVVADPDVPREARDRLRLVPEIKEFGETRMGLAATDNYTSYYDTGGRPITFLVSACAKDAFRPVTWWFPVVGEVPYKGFFSREDAEAEARALERAGYDVVLGGTAAYSTLGWFRDPVLSTMLDGPPERMAALILHEMTHATLYVPGDTAFNEGLASFTGWQGALEFARWRFGIRSPEYARTVAAFAAEERRDAEAREVYGKLRELYALDLPAERKIELRDVVAGRPVNNARILMQRRYGRYEEFRRAFEEAGGDWRRFFEAVRPE